MPGEDKYGLAAWYREFAERAGNPRIGKHDCAQPTIWKRRPTASKPNSLSLCTKRKRSRTTTR